MKKLEQDLLIAELIVKSLQGELTLLEQTEINEWRAQNEAEYQRMISSTKFVEDYRKYAYFETTKSPNFVKRLIQNSSKQQLRKKYYRITATAAAIMIPIIVTLFLIKPSVTTDKSRTQALTTIEAGGNKAVLILGDGKKIELGGQDSLLVAQSVATEAQKRACDRSETNTLIVPKGGRYTVQLSDGTVIYLNSDSRLSYPVKFTGARREVSFEGEAYFDVMHSDKQFVVNTALGQIKVYGTEFNIKRYADENTLEATLVKGKISYTGATIAETIITPQHQLVYYKGESTCSMKRVNTDLYTSWRNNIFSFEDQTLEQIMKTLSRWYNIEFRFEDQASREIRLSGRMGRFSNFDSFIKLFSTYEKIDFEVEGNMVTIRSKK